MLEVQAVAQSPALSPPKPAESAPAPQASSAALPSAAGDRLTLSAATTFNFPDLKPGESYKVKGTYKGHGFGGHATVNTMDGRTLDVTVNASAMLIIHVKVHIRFQTLPDGSVRFLGERMGGDKPKDGTPDKAGAGLQVVAAKPGETLLQGEDGKPISVQTQPSGGVRISYDTYQITLGGKS